MKSGDFGAIVIENVRPELDGGLCAAKCTAGEIFEVEADIFKDGHDVLGADVLFREKKRQTWQRTPMHPLGNDRWKGSFTPPKNTRYVYTLEAWVSPLLSWAENTRKKCKAGEFSKSDLEEGLLLLVRAQKKIKGGADKQKIASYIKLLRLAQGSCVEVLAFLDNPDFKDLIARYPLRHLLSQYPKTLELICDRKRAVWGAWYEMFPRSQGKKAGVSGRFSDCIARLPDIRRMGFDVLYLPPIHPIGVTNRKGPENSLEAGPNAEGSPWAVGNQEGGHKAIHPALGTMADFMDLVSAAREYGMEIALDLAYQCSPDHPYVKEHPEWFHHRPDGSIHYAENPPKKYQDIYPLNFYGPHQQALWEELKSIAEFWIKKGIRIFRVDNPHTKPLRFWRWLIDSVQEKYPDVIFLAEAFTRPKVMKFLAKNGFTQSYTYFTWRNSKEELRRYMEELMSPEMKSYFRGNLFANTPDILHAYLQHGARPAFKIRLVLAATLSSVYGIYSGYELCESRAHPGTEEYRHSEKYESRVWDWNRPGNIKEFIARVNRIRSQHPALQEYKNLEFYHTNNEHMLSYGKMTADRSDIIVVVVNLDPYSAHEDTVALPLEKFGVHPGQAYQMKDLLTGEKYYWRGAVNYVRLDPHVEPAHIFQLRK